MVFSEEFGKIELYHLWLQYLPSQFFHKDWEKASSKSNANGFSDIKIEFKTWGLGLEVTKCGAHLVFKQDIEDLKQTMVGSSSCSITPYDENQQAFKDPLHVPVGPITRAGSKKIKEAFNGLIQEI